MIFDTFMINGHPDGPELDILECRLYELQGVPGVVHVAVEADVDHQGHPKPYWLSESLGRFAQWADRLRVVRATGLPTVEENRDAWSREHAQREHVADALVDASPDDIVLHGDLDEIPKAVVVRNVKPSGFVAFDMACYSMAVDWQHPERWRGTVAGKVRNVRSFAGMRDIRNFAPVLPAAGWHLGWLGGQQAQLTKLGSFCHPEIAERTRSGITDDVFLREGWHVDGAKLIPVDVNETWPKWIAERRCPESWFRDRVIAA